MRRIRSLSSWWQWLVLAVVAVLALGATGAQAAPQLTATPSTINLSSCRATGATTLTWTGVLPTVPNATHTDLYVNNTMVQANLPPIGSYSLTVPVGTHTAALKQFTIGIGEQTVATVTVTVTCTPPTPSCPEPCFTTPPTVTPHGTFATFSVTTSQPTTVGIFVGTQKPGPDGHLPPASIVGKTEGVQLAAKTPATIEVFGLTPKTFYHFEVQATDANGYVHKSLGTFTTLTRHIEVQFKSIFMINDSDDDSEGDLTFGFMVNNGAPKSIKAEAETKQSVVSPVPSLPLALFIINDAPAILTLDVTGCDDDTPDFPVAISGCNGLAFGSNGSSPKADWASVQATFDISKTAGKGENHTLQFTMTANSLSPLKYEVNCKFIVSYK